MRLIDGDALFRKVKTECNPYGKPTIGFEDGKRVMDWIEHATTVGGWVSVKDRMPDNQRPVIVYVPPHVDGTKGTFLGYVGMAYYTSLGEGFWCGTDGNLYGTIGTIYPPTHWMPLLEPPEVDK